MKGTFFALILLYSLTACHVEKMTHKETVTKYYQAKDAVDYDKVLTSIHDSITIVEGSYIMPYDRVSFHEVFRWDSIFQPRYELVDIVEKNDQVIASVILNSIRNKFLKNSEMTCQYQVSFVDGKISLIESLDCQNVDWRIWQKEVNSLVNWINENHPHLNGFINDMTMTGALNYLKAIELYQADQNIR